MAGFADVCLQPSNTTTPKLWPTRWHPTRRSAYTGGLPSVESPNDEYSQAAVMGARLRLYAGRLDQAETRLADMRAHAPLNLEVRAWWASLQLTREKPRVALEEFTLLQVDDPKSIDAAVGRGESLLALNQFEEARQVLGTLMDSYPENRAVQNLARKIEYHDGLTLLVDTTLGKGGSIAGAESLVDSMLYSMPLKDSLGESFRVFAHVSQPSLTPLSRRIGWGGVTFLFWALWFYLWLPFITLIGWAFGYYQASTQFSWSQDATELKHLFVLYITVISWLGGSLLMWARIEYLRFCNVNRRAAPTAASAEELAAYAGLRQC